MNIIKIPQTFFRSRLLSKPVSSCTVFFAFFIFACNPAPDQQRVEMPSANRQSAKSSHKTVDSLTVSPVFPGGDVIQVNCEFIQDQAEILLEEYYKHGTSDNRLKKIIIELERLNQEWIKSDCQQVFGFMVPEIPSRPKPIK